jgi:hypothetical protein
MNLGRGSARLFLVVFIAWTLSCAAGVAWREWSKADADLVAACRIQQQAVAQFDIGKCLQDPAALARKHRQAVAHAEAWFLEGGYLAWLVPPILVTALAVILIACGAFVYRGFRAE